VLLGEMFPDFVRRAGLSSAVQAGEAEAVSPKCSCMQSIAGKCVLKIDVPDWKS
jgi:hypothetical protein